MGLNLAYLPFFDVCNGVIPMRGVMKVIGSQTMHDPEEELIRYARKMAYARFEKEPSVRNLFLERYGISDYTDYDINDSADVKIDFGLSIPECLHNSCDVLLNAGTLEHIFNISCAVKNMHDMLRRGVFLLILFHTHGTIMLTTISIHVCFTVWMRQTGTKELLKLFIIRAMEKNDVFPSGKGFRLQG